MQFAMFVPLAILPFQSAAIHTTNLVLGGPNGWELLTDVEHEANLAEDMGYMYEWEDTNKRLNLYKSGTGMRQDQVLTLETLGLRNSRYEVKDPVGNMFVNCFDQIGLMNNENSGLFDGKPVHNYANTLILDLFGLDNIHPSRGIEKEGILILGLWMQIYHHLYEAVAVCRGGGIYYYDIENEVDKAAALWIGRLQIFGDNTRGTMLYNLVERVAVAFNQDDGEAKANTKFISTMREMMENRDDCYHTKLEDNKGYHNLYKLVNDAVGIMYIPLIQNLIHYIATDANSKLIELYLIPLLPQIRSCNPDYFDFLFTRIGQLSSGNYPITEMVDIIDHLQSMYSCFGVTCKDIGYHSSGIGCDDEVAEPNIPLAGYMPENNMQNFMKFDRDVNQMSMLLLEQNIESAKEVYLKGKNVSPQIGGDGDYQSLQDLARSRDFLSVKDDESRLYSMYEEFYGNYFADDIVLDAFHDTTLAPYKIPILMKAMVLPQFAIRSFFAAVDKCGTSVEEAIKSWDESVAVLVGSIEATKLLNETKSGMSWWDLGRDYCSHFNCAGSEEESPSLRKMMTNIELGRQSLDRSDCTTAKKKVQAIESIIITPIIQGLLYHTAQRQRTEDDYHVGAAYAFGKAIMPVISKRRPADANIIGDTLYTSGTYDATNLWTVIVLSLRGFGIDCEDMGEDTLNILGGKTFCHHATEFTEFPTTAPTSAAANIPTPLPTISPTADDASTEINAVVLNGYIFSNLDNSTKLAKIALDLRDFLALRGHFDVEHEQAKDIYKNGYHSSFSMKELGEGMQYKMANDPFFNFYRNSFRKDPLFRKDQEDDDTFADIYAHKILTDALEAGRDVDLAYETAVCMIIWMEVAHLLYTAVKQCGASDRPTDLAGLAIDDALAYYVGVSQTKGSTDGYLLYSLAQKSASIFGTVDELSGEAIANKDMMKYFKEAKRNAGLCDGGPEQAKVLRSVVGSMMSTMNIPLVQSFVHQLQVGLETDKGSFHAILYGLSVLPQVATCQPTEYEYLTNEITANGLDVANLDSLTISFRKTYECFGIVCRDVHGINYQGCDLPLQHSFAGFTPKYESIRSNAMIDQDVLKMRTLLSENALIAALDYYEYGHLSSQQTSSLRDLARDPGLKQNSFFQTLKKYHKNDDFFADKKIMLALREEAPFYNISADVRTSLVARSLQTLVLLPAAIGSMYKTASEAECTFQHWDEGAAYLIGSIEGPQWGGDSGDNGVAMYGLAKELCNEFRVCTPSGNAETNERLIEYLSNGEDLISGGSCASVNDHIEMKVVPTLMATLVQGTILYAGKPTARGDAHVFAETILPFINEDGKSNATVIAGNSRLDYTGSSMEVIDAFSHVLSNMGVDCEEVGSFEGNVAHTLCKDTYDPDQSTDLSDGLYITKTSVRDRAMIGLDIKEMIEKLNDGYIEGAKIIYEQGWKSNIVDKNGKKLGKRSIASLGRDDAIEKMSKEPLYNLYQYALGDFTDEKFGYADYIVLQFFDESIFNQGRKTLAAEAAVALVIWGFIVHELYETIDRCSNDGFSKDEDGIHSIDEAVAYWIGEGQETGSKTSGYLLYRLAEEGGELFGQKTGGSQSQTNKNVLQLFREAALNLSFDGACGGNQRIITSLNFIINKLLAQMMVPLIQHLIYNLKRNDRSRVKIYSHAVVPLLAPCASNTYDYLKKKLIATNYEITEVDTIIAYLQKSYSCLGLKCRDVGTLQGLETPRCADRQEFSALAGYKTTTDVREYSDIYLDIRYIDIMMKQDMKEAPLNIYMFGKHSIVTERNERSYLPLRKLAITTDLGIVPSYATFQNYYEKAGLSSADDLIRNELNSPDTKGSPDQKRTLVVSAMKYEILHFAALQKLYDAAQGCKSLDQNRFARARHEWDTAAALIIGQTNDPINENKGDLLYELAASQCAEFNACDSKTGDAQINQRIEASFYAGSYLLKSRSCESVRMYADAIQELLMASLIQATLLHAINNSKLPVGTDDPSLARGFILSRSILPYIDLADPNAAAIIKENLDFQFFRKPVHDGADAIFRSFTAAINKMDIDCKIVGYHRDSGSVCGSDSVSSAPTKKLLTLMIAIGSITVYLIS